MFDFNGTLSDDEPLLLSIYQQLFARHGRPLPEDAYYGDLAGKSEETIIGTWLGVDGPLLAMLVQERIDAYTALAASGSTVTSPVREAVRYAATRVPVAIVSGAFRAEIEPVVAAAGIAGELSTIVTADDVEHGKPHPEGYLLAVERLGIDPARTHRVRGHRGRCELGEGRGSTLPRRTRHAARRAAGACRRADRHDRRGARGTPHRVAARAPCDRPGHDGHDLPRRRRGPGGHRARLPRDLAAVSPAGVGRARPARALGERPRDCGDGARRGRDPGRRAVCDRPHEPARDDDRVGAGNRAAGVPGDRLAGPTHRGPVCRAAGRARPRADGPRVRPVLLGQQARMDSRRGRPLAGGARVRDGRHAGSPGT